MRRIADQAILVWLALLLLFSRVAFADDVEVVQSFEFGDRSEFFTLPESNPWHEYNRMLGARDGNAHLMQYVAQNTVARWYSSGNQYEVAGQVDQQLQAAAASQQIAVLVLYNIPHRDCGSYSSGGAAESAYLDYVQAFAAALGRSEAYVIVEPDALASADCLDQLTRFKRFELISSVLQILKSRPNTHVYLDIGHPYWLNPDEAARRLIAVGITEIDGFSLNVSNFVDDHTNIQYGQKIRELVGKNFVIDSSRNGNGPHPTGEWCNPAGRALGRRSQRVQGVAGLDAFLWIKVPGESDGDCNGHPPAGHFSPHLALELSQNRCKLQFSLSTEWSAP